MTFAHLPPLAGGGHCVAAELAIAPLASMAAPVSIPRRPASVAFYIPSLAGGGVEKMKLFLIEEFLRRGISTTLILTRFSGDLLADVPPGCEVVALNSQRTAADVLPLARLLRKRRPDILIASLNHNNIAAMLARLLQRRTALIISQHNALSMEAGPHGKLGYRLVPLMYRILSPLADGIVAVSSGVADDLAATAKLGRGRITTIHNPVLDRRFDERSRAPAIHPWLAQTEIPVFVTAGRLVWQKDHATLLRAMRLRLSKGPARLLILGSGPDRAELEAQAAALGIAPHVDFCGFVQNPLPYVRESAAFILSSRHEGFGNVLVESMGCGTPVISTDCPYGPSEILENGEHGCMVPVGDDAGIAAAMEQDLRARWPAARLRARAEAFRTTRVADEYLGLMRNVLGAGAPRA